MAVPIKPNIGTKSDFAPRPSVPSSQKESSTEFNLIVSAIRANYERLILNWDTDVGVNITLPVGQYVLFSNNVYIIDTAYNVGSPITWDAAKASIVIASSPEHFKGVYADETALNTAYPTADPGDYALVDVGASDAALYIWDDTDTQWVASGVTTIIPDADETTKGLSEEATDAEVSAGTATGGTGAKLFITPTKLQTWWTAIKAATITFTSWLKASQFVTLYQTLTDAATIAWDANSGAYAQITLGGNRTLGAMTNMQTGGTYQIRVIQDGTGNRTLAFNAQYTFPGSVTPILNPAAGAATVFRFVYDGTAMRYIMPSGNVKFDKLYATQFVTTFQTLTDAATIAWDAASGSFAQVTLGGNRTLGAITNMQTGGLFILRVIQDGTGNRTLAFNAQYTFPGSVTPILNPAAAAATVLVFFYDGTAMRFCNASGDYKLANLYLSAQAATGSNQRPLYIDSTGKVFKSAMVNHDETNKKITVTGGATTHTVVYEILNSALDAIAKFYNDQVAEFGGSTGVISITTGVVSGGAYLEINSNQAEAFKIVDKAANTYVTYNSTTGALAMRTHQKMVNEQGLGFEKVTLQVFLTTSGSAGATNLITNVALATDTAIDLTVNHLFAFEQDNGAVVIANGGRKGVAKNIGGTVTGAFDSFTVLSPAGTTATWSLVADNTNKRININFINNTGSGLIYDIALDFSYILRPLPTS